jgi:hypothetical protein
VQNRGNPSPLNAVLDISLGGRGSRANQDASPLALADGPSLGMEVEDVSSPLGMEPRRILHTPSLGMEVEDVSLSVDEEDACTTAELAELRPVSSKTEDAPPRVRVEMELEPLSSPRLHPSANRLRVDRIDTLLEGLPGECGTPPWRRRAVSGTTAPVATPHAPT